MREIKFRIFDNGRMIYGAIVGHPVNSSVYVDGEWKECTPNAVVMQFTGLKDKNSKEIYEGDFLRIKDTYHSENDIEIGIMEFQKVETRFMAKVSEDGWRGIYKDQHEIEVIGNIWESPELLK